MPQPLKTFVVFHNDPRANSLFNGFYLRKLVNPREKLIAPPALRNRIPELQSITDAPTSALAGLDG